jgi:hypothetical protein
MPLLLVLGCTGAQPKAPDEAGATLAEARRVVAEAKAEYEAGHFGRAADLYERVYRLKPVPGLLFNLGQAARAAHDFPRAERAYQAYLLLGDLQRPDRLAIERAVLVLRAAINGGADPLVAILEIRGPAPENAAPRKGRGAAVTSDSMYLTNVVRSLAADRGLNVMTRENVEVLLANRSASVADCVDKCEVEIARVLGAEYVMSGELLRTSDGAFRATVQLHDSASARFLAGTQAGGASVAAVEAGLRGELDQLFDRLLAYAADKARREGALPPK